MLSILKKLFALDDHHHPIDRLADLNALVSGVALYPQLYKLIMGELATGLSMATFVIIAANSLIWIIYGIHRKSLPLIISSALNFVSAGTITSLIIF